MAKGMKLTDKVKTDIVSLHLQGYSYKYIAHECDIHKNSVYNVLNFDKYTLELLEENKKNYKEEILNLALDTVKEALLDEELTYRIKLGYVQTAMKYSGALTDKVEVIKKEDPLDLEALYKEFNIS